MRTLKGKSLLEYFCGEVYFQHDFPCRLTKWRKRLSKTFRVNWRDNLSRSESSHNPYLPKSGSSLSKPEKAKTRVTVYTAPKSSVSPKAKYRKNTNLASKPALPSAKMTTGCRAPCIVPTVPMIITRSVRRLSA